MCLEKLIPIDKKDPNQVRYGYKVFLQAEDGIMGDIIFNVDNAYIPENTWIHESKYRYHEDKGRQKINANLFYDENVPSYPFGFHVFLSKKAAEKWISDDIRTIRRVKYRKLVASGYQTCSNGFVDIGLYRVDVAKEIYIIEETPTKTKSSTSIKRKYNARLQ